MNIGDYVRTDKGLIGKVIKKEEYTTHTILEYEGQYCKRVLTLSGNDSEIIKSSPNIIDLIEEGDYVNGLKVTRICFDEDGERILNTENCILELINEDIKSIVTHEQFSQMEYKVGE